MLSIVLLTWQLSSICPLVRNMRNVGYSDAQIEEIARLRNVPEWVITFAKKKCGA
jgi:hypothetical protein